MVGMGGLIKRHTRLKNNSVANNKLKSEEKMIGSLDIEIYEKAGVGFAQAKYLVHGFEDVFWTDDIDEALAFLKRSIIDKERSL